MAGIDPVSNIIKTGAKAVETVAGVFTENAEKGAQREANQQKALLKAYQAEFHQRTNRTVLDAFADGFNRLVRPAIVTIIISIFLVAYISPERFATISLAMTSIPGGYWALLSVIIGFYFGGRMQLKSQDFQLKQGQLDAVSALIETKKEFRKLEMDTDEPDRAVGDTEGKSEANQQARESSKNGVIEAYKKVRESNKKEQALADAAAKMKENSQSGQPSIFVLDEMVGG